MAEEKNAGYSEDTGYPQDTMGTQSQDIQGNELINYSDVTGSYPELSPTPIDKRPLIAGVIFASVFLLISIILGVWLYFHPVTAEIVRDIVIIFLGISSFFILICMVILIIMIAYLVLKTNDLVQLLDREVRPLLYNIQETTSTVRGTSTFVSDYAVQPIISTVANVAAVKAIFRSLFRR